MAEVELKDVRKAFDASRAVLAGVSFTVADGEFVSLLGPSGCGKTTLLRIVAGLERADSGEVRIGGREVSPLPPKDRDIAMVFQSYALYPHLTVSENIGMGLKLRGAAPEDIGRRTAEAAGKLGLTELLARRPGTLSGGQRQRVALARCLVRAPKAFLLDEPLSNLDAVLRERTRGELKLLFKAVKGTVIYVTHDQVEAMTLSDRVVVLDRGRIQQIGTPGEIYRLPANTFVAGFLGAPPMNVVPLAEAARAGLAAPPSGRGPEGILWGIRPEDVEVSAGGQDQAVSAEVALAEPTGAQTVLTLQAGGVSLRACVPGSWDLSRTRVRVRVPPAKVHHFDEASGERVPGPRPAG